MTVPADWDRADATGGWEPPNADGTTSRRSRSAPARTGRPQDGSGEGVFVALLPGTVLPEQVPAAPRVRDRRPRRSQDSQDGDDSRTVVYSDCPGGGVIVERVVQVAANTLLWVQVRSDDRATANQVLDDVETHGI